MMRSRWWRIIRSSLMAALLAGLLAACSAVRLAYNNADEAAWWWLTDYLEFNDAQRPAVRQAVDEAHAWHRRSQLPGYAELLASWQPRLSSPLDAPQVCAMVGEVAGRLADFAGLADALPPQALAALASIDAAQLADLQRRMDRANQKFRDKYIDVSPQELAANRLEQGRSRAERLYGTLGPEQVRALEAALARSPWDVRGTYARRLKRQQAIVQQLRDWQGAPPEQVRAGLRRLIATSFEPADPADRAASLAARQQSCQVLAELHNSTTPAQRARAVDTLRRYVDDFKTLAQPV